MYAIGIDDLTVNTQGVTISAGLKLAYKGIIPLKSKTPKGYRSETRNLKNRADRVYLVEELPNMEKPVECVEYVLTHGKRIW